MDWLFRTARVSSDQLPVSSSWSSGLWLDLRHEGFQIADFGLWIGGVGSARPRVAGLRLFCLIQGDAASVDRGGRRPRG